VYRSEHEESRDQDFTRQCSHTMAQTMLGGQIVHPPVANFL